MGRVSDGKVAFVPRGDAGLAFNYSGSSQNDSRSGDIRIGAHRFDGSGKVLAHTYFPPPNGSTAAGDAHSDSSEAWVLTGGSAPLGGGGVGGGKGGGNLELWEPEPAPVQLLLTSAGAAPAAATPTTTAPVRVTRTGALAPAAEARTTAAPGPAGETRYLAAAGTAARAAEFDRLADPVAAGPEVG